VRGLAIALLFTLATGQPAAVAAAQQPVRLAALSLEGLENEVPAKPADVPVIEEPVIEEPVIEEPPENETVRPYAPLRSRNACPTEPEALTAALIRDIPNYTNRVLQRTTAVLNNAESSLENPFSDNLLNNPLNDLSTASILTRSPYRPSYVLVAGSLNLTPLDLNEYAFTTAPEAGGPLTQVFFTTLSRQYSGLRFNEVQEYHWLFLAPTADGWWPAFIFSSVDNPATVRAPSPPRENSRGSVGQAVQLWLRDCRAGTIEPVD
jgi:hypothetical protein